MPYLSAGTEANGRRGGEDDRRAACPRASHSSPPIKRSIEASIVCSSNSSWSSLSSRSWKKGFAGHQGISLPCGFEPRERFAERTLDIEQRRLVALLGRAQLCGRSLLL
jgi:hypothetical protein